MKLVKSGKEAENNESKAECFQLNKAILKRQCCESQTRFQGDTKCIRESLITLA